ncbi:LacI family DNA-binding transcriptional regulator [Roseibium sp.]|uniref:LacI family DNA-binding transcriptional regulator n=1 Tax=Roseibium sp. TaxID=1936156 RepID=UPI003B517634
MKKGHASPSIKDVAKHAGVSISSVSRVINDRSGTVSSETRRRVQEAIDELGYRPNRAGRALRGQANDTYALVISNIHNNFYAAVAWEIERILNDRGQALLMFNSNEDVALQDRALEDMRSRQVAGIFMLCALESDKLTEANDDFPVIFINRRVTSMPDVPFVGIDDYSAAREITSSMLRMYGHSAAFIHGPQSSDTSSRRLKGMMDACADHGKTIDANDVREASLSMESGYETAVEMLSQKRYSAIVCGNDQIAYGVYRRCRELGLSVPEDVAIFGFDDNPMNQWLAPWLNTVRVPHVQLALSALDQMEIVQGGETGRNIVLPYDLVLKG